MRLTWVTLQTHTPQAYRHLIKPLSMGTAWNLGSSLCHGFLVMRLHSLHAGLPPVFSCQDLNLWGHLEGETCFSKPVPLLLHCIWSAFDQGSMVTLPDTLAVGTTLAVLPEIMCREKKCCNFRDSLKGTSPWFRSNNILFYHLVYINDLWFCSSKKHLHETHIYCPLTLSVSGHVCVCRLWNVNVLNYININLLL